MSDVPPYVTPADVGNACGISRKRAQRMLKKAGLLEWDGKRWQVNADQLMAQMPPVHTRVFAYFNLQATAGPSGPERAQAGRFRSAQGSQ